MYLHLLSYFHKKYLGASFSVFEIPHVPGSPGLKEIMSAVLFSPASEQWAKTKSTSVSRTDSCFWFRLPKFKKLVKNSLKFSESS